MPTPAMDQWMLDTLGVDVRDGEQTAPGRPAVHGSADGALAPTDRLRASVERAYPGLKTRLQTINGKKPGEGKVLGSAAWTACEEQFIALSQAKDADQWAQASRLLAMVERSMRRLEVASARMVQLERAAAAEAAKIGAMTDAQLRSTKPADQAAMVRTLLAGGDPAGPIRAAQLRVYKAMQLDPGFVQRDDDRGTLIAQDLSGNNDLIKARDTWAAMDDNKKLGALKLVAAAQSKRLNIPPPDIEFGYEATPDDASTSQAGVITINMTADGAARRSFAAAVDTTIHENSHRYAQHLARQLVAGKLKPGAPDYPQALLFAANDIKPGGNVRASEDYEAYRKEPTEAFAWHAGPATALKIMAALGQVRP